MRINLMFCVSRFTQAALLMTACITLAQATPNIQSWQSPSGAKVLFVEDRSIPMLDIAVTLPAGSSYDVAGKSGISGLTHHVMSLGAADLAEDDISRQMADLGAIFGGGFEQEMASKTLRTLSKPEVRDAAISIMAKVLQQPNFPEAILEREKARVLAALKESETKPEFIADKTFERAVFGDHPYGYSTSGEAAVVSAATKADLEAFYKQFYSRRAAVVAIMGDVSRADAERIAEQLTAQLPDSTVNTKLAAVPTRISASEQRIEHPASQSHILLGAPGMARNDPDYFALFVGNYVLGGGGFVSRLMNEVREKRGLSYSVYSYFQPFQQSGQFQIGLQTKKEQVDEALKVARDTLSEFIQHGPSETELKAAKNNLVGGFPLRIDSNSKILNYLSVIGFYNLPLTYLADFTRNIEQVSAKQVQQAFARVLDSQAMATVIVGAPVKNSTSEVTK